jgi:hypothetical protein
LNFTRTVFAAGALSLASLSTAALAQDVGATIMGNAENAGVWSVNITKGELDAQMDQAVAEAAARLEAALVPGTAVVTADAKPLGAIDMIDGGNVVVKGENDFIVTLPKDMFAVNAEGALMALANHADILAALEAAGG